MFFEMENGVMKKGNQSGETAIQVVTTTDKREDAEKIAGILIEKRLAACVQIVGPVLSIYRWEKSIENAEEWQCHIKTRGGLYADVEAAIKANHPYKTPEIIALHILQGSREYLTWLHEETQDES
jgi:periplasmic divalent cation tolerance protein